MPEELALDQEKLEEAVAKETGEETQGETTPSETSGETEASTRDKASLKSEEEAGISEKEEKIRFDQHPDWQRIKRERDEARSELSELQFLKEKVGDLSPDELARFKNAASVLRKYPQLQASVQKVIDEFNYGSEETKTEIDALKQKQADLEADRILDKYETAVEKLMIKNKVSDNMQPIIKEILDNRVASARIKNVSEITEVFDKLLKDIEKISRVKEASYVKSKLDEKPVPASVKDRGKSIISKTESEETEDIVKEITDGMKASSEKFGKE